MKTALVTGASDGIGTAIADGLCARGWHVIVHGRDEARLRDTCVGLRQRHAGARVDWVRADFGALDEVRSLGRYISDNYERLDALIHNAGTVLPARRESTDGFELTLAVNHIAPFALTQGLAALLQATARTRGEARVVVTASNVHLGARFNWEDPHATRRYDMTEAYAASKLANVWFAKALARRWAAVQVGCHALHPGVVSTKLLRTGYGMSGISVTEGAAPALHVATAPELRGVTGRYFDGLRERAAVAARQDETEQERLWSLSEAWATPRAA